MKKPVKTEVIDKSFEQNTIDTLYSKVSNHIDNARKNIQSTTNTEVVSAYWLIGKDIVEEEQSGTARATYGSFLLKSLSERLTKKYGKGFSIPTLKNARQFFLVYHNYVPIGYTLRSQFTFSSKLGWSHYRALMRIKRPEARRFYEIEAESNNWPGRVLERQIGSLLFDRLAKSKDKKGLMRLACKGHEINEPEDTMKDPIILEFLDIPESHRLVESKLEEALIDNLQHFLLELGKGFAFVARQKRLTLDNQHFYADLVFYSIPLKAYLIIDLKTHPLTHADLGQIQMYVNYFDQEIKMEHDNPTIGLVLCTEKSNSMVKYFLGDKAKQIFASTYQFNLPTIEELEDELKREIEEIKYKLKNKKL